MAAYPIHVPRSPYRGNNAAHKRRRARYDEDAARIEAYLNRETEHSPSPSQVFEYAMIAKVLGMGAWRVADILGRVAESNAAITVTKPAREATPEASVR